METPQQVTTYTYDNAGNLTTITQGTEVTTIEYDENHLRRQLTYPNGIVATYAYDDAQRLTSLVYQSGQTVIESLQYTYDPNGNILQRLRSATGSKQESAKAAAYDPLTNRLMAFNGETFAYDDNGNLATRTTTCGITTYTWNVKNQLIGMNGFQPNCAALTASFAYDALGRRIQKTVNGQTTTFLHDGLDVIAEIGNNTATYLRTNNIDEAIARYSVSGDRYFLADMLGSTQVLTDSAGTTTTTYSYSPFGQTDQTGQANDNPSQYTGRESDGTGLYYYRARYYAPELARFITSDPIGLDGGLNTYAYVLNNPLSWNDPTGLDPFEIPGWRKPFPMRPLAPGENPFDDWTKSFKGLPDNPPGRAIGMCLLVPAARAAAGEAALSGAEAIIGSTVVLKRLSVWGLIYHGYEAVECLCQ